MFLFIIKSRKPSSGWQNFQNGCPHNGNKANVIGHMFRHHVNIVSVMPSVIWLALIEAEQDRTNQMTGVTSKDSDQPGLISPWSVLSKKEFQSHWCLWLYRNFPISWSTAEPKKLCGLLAKTRISLCVYAIYCMQFNQSFHCPHEDAFGPWLSIEHLQKTAYMHRLIWVFAGHTTFFSSTNR